MRRVSGGVRLRGYRGPAAIDALNGQRPGHVTARSDRSDDGAIAGPPVDVDRGADPERERSGPWSCHRAWHYFLLIGCFRRLSKRRLLVHRHYVQRNCARGAAAIVAEMDLSGEKRGAGRELRADRAIGLVRIHDLTYPIGERAAVRRRLEDHVVDVRGAALGEVAAEVRGADNVSCAVVRVDVQVRIA